MTQESRPVAGRRSKGHVSWADVKSKIAAATVEEQKAALAKAMADALLDGVDLPPNWSARLEAADSPEQLRAIRASLLHQVAERNRAEAEEYRQTGRRPDRLADTEGITGEEEGHRGGR